MRRGVSSLAPVIRLDAATVLLQWATGGWCFLWFSTRTREIGPGYGWLLRSIYLVMAMYVLAGVILLAAVHAARTTTVPRTA